MAVLERSRAPKGTLEIQIRRHAPDGRDLTAFRGGTLEGRRRAEPRDLTPEPRHCQRQCQRAFEVDWKQSSGRGRSANPRRPTVPGQEQSLAKGDHPVN